MRFALFMLIVVASGAGCAKPSDHPEIRQTLDAQIAAWNRGDLEGFMAGYWRSDELIFTSPKGTTTGWQPTLDRYRRSYPTKEKMGRLRFDNVTVSPRGQDQAQVAGQFLQKTREKTDRGRFFLEMRRIDGKWVIVKDHTVGE